MSDPKAKGSSAKRSRNSRRGMRSAQAQRSKRPASRAQSSPKNARGSKSEEAGRSREFPVVAIGASAGGLEAITQLLKALPNDTGMAFLLMQHHDPKHESTLQEILSHATRMPVHDAAPGMKLDPNTVYVLPSNAEVVDGTFRFSRNASRRMPIDGLFRSLAEQHKTRAIGIVLSGTLSDGALGLRTIKAEGGVTFAQNEESAKFRDMPLAAIAAGSVDLVATPEGIARELTRMGTHPYIRRAKALPEELFEGSDHEKIVERLREATGVDFSHYRQTTIKRRIARRMAVRRVDRLSKYMQVLRDEPSEVHALYEDVLITVTGFFRDPKAFTALRAVVMPAILRDRAAGNPVRIWVPGCSTGEEVYSIAMVLFETLRDLDVNPPIQIFATDISDSAIEKARAGIYLENAMVDVSPDRRKRFFLQVEGGFQVSKAIRDICVFARQNVTADPPFSNLDLISCRNMLIYLEQVLQKRVIPLFHYALKPSGFLMLGSAETITGFSDLFSPVDRAGRIFVKRAGHTRHMLDFATPRDVSSDRAPAEVARPGGAGAFDLQREADRQVLSRFGPAGVLINEHFDAVQFRGKTGPYLETPPGAASFNVLKMAREGLLVDLRAAILQAKKSGRPVRRGDVRVRQNGTFRKITLEVVPIRQGANGAFFLVLFEDPAARPAEPTPAVTAFPRRKGEEHETIQQLEQELSGTKDYLQSIIEEQEVSNEELKSANEEILSSNEELQSTNEELETAKEELQSTNEELTTVNEELQNRNLELAQANNDLLNLVAGINMAILMLGPDGRIRRFTPQAEKLFNLISTDVGRMIGDIKPNVDVPDLGERVSQAIQNVQTHEREVQDETGQWYLMRIRPYRTSDNRIDGAIVAFLDIDPLKRSLEQASRARSYSDALVETVRESLIVLDDKLRIRTANQAFYKSFETTPLQTEGKRLVDLFDLARQVPDLESRLQKVLDERGTLTEFEFEFEFDVLGRRVLCISARRVRLPGEGTPFLMLAAEDITERRMSERLLKQSEEQYRRLFESAREGILVLAAGSGEILDVNKYLVDRLEYPREELIGRKPWRIEIFEQPEQARASFQEVRKKGFAFDREVIMKARSGGLLQFESIANSVQTDTSHFVQYNLRDTSERARLEEQVRQIQKLESVGTLAGGIAHDFNNLLNIISAHLALLEREGTGDAASHRHAIEQAVKRASAVVNQLLTFARKSEVTLGDVDVNAIVREIAGMLRETFPRNISIHVQLDDDLSSIRGDANQLHQALLNLCVNARDAMDEGGRLTLRSEVVRGEVVREQRPDAAAKQYVRVTVADTGTGIDAETRQRLFEPFFTTKKDRGGQGMGLAVVYGIVNGQHGWIDLETEVGRGTTFRLYFPAAEDESARNGRNAHEKGFGHARRTRGAHRAGKILLIEDEEMLRRPIQSLLESEGYNVLTASDGVEAVSTYKTHRDEISAVLLDLGLPKLDGWQAFLQMKNSDPNVRCIVASGNIDREQRARMKDAGIAAALRKPYGAEEVLSTLRTVLASE